MATIEFDGDYVGSETQPNDSNIFVRGAAMRIRIVGEPGDVQFFREWFQDGEDEMCEDKIEVDGPAVMVFADGYISICVVKCSDLQKARRIIEKYSYAGYFGFSCVVSEFGNSLKTTFTHKLINLGDLNVCAAADVIIHTAEMVHGAFTLNLDHAGAVVRLPAGRFGSIEATIRKGAAVIGSGTKTRVRELSLAGDEGSEISDMLVTEDLYGTHLGMVENFYVTHLTAVGGNIQQKVKEYISFSGTKRRRPAADMDDVWIMQEGKYICV